MIADALDDVQKSLVSTDVSLLMRLRFEKAYGVFSYEGVGDLDLGVVRMNEAERVLRDDPLPARLREFIELGVATKLNISFVEYMEQPRWVCEMMIEECRRANKHEDSLANRLQQELNQQQSRK